MYREHRENPQTRHTGLSIQKENVLNLFSLFKISLIYKYSIYKYSIYKYFISNITLKIPWSTFRYVMVFNHIKSRCSISFIHTQSTTGYTSHHILKYMKNNKITVEESSRIPPTCFPASQMLDSIDNITFSSIWYILLNRIKYRHSTDWLAVQSNSQHTINQPIFNSSKNTTWNYKLFRVSEIYSHLRVNR